MEEHNILIPLLLPLGAGLATGIGSALAFFAAAGGGGRARGAGRAA